MRIYCCGSQGVGTSTWAVKIHEYWGYHLIPDSVRVVAGEGLPNLDKIRADPVQASQFQLRVFQKQVAMEYGLKEFVSDQAFDNLAYAIQFTPIGEDLLHSKYVKRYAETLDRDDVIIFYFRPHKEFIVSDGFRASGDLKFQSVMRTDGVIFSLINQFRLMRRTTIISSENTAERLKQIVERLGPPKRGIDFDVLWAECLEFVADKAAFEKEVFDVRRSGSSGSLQQN